MKWNRNVNEIPPKIEVLVLTVRGERLIARRNRKNGRYLDVKAPTHDKIEWLKKEIDLKRKWWGMPFCPIAYWSRVNKLTKKQHDAVFAPTPGLTGLTKQRNKT